MQFLNEGVYYEGGNIQTYRAPCEKVIPSHPNSWVGRPYQQQLQSSVLSLAVEEFWRIRLCRVAVIQPHFI